MALVWISRVAGWAFKRIGSSNLISLACLGTVLGSITVGLGTILQGQDSVRLTLISYLALLIAWALARSPLRGGQAGLFFVLLGGIFILLGTGGLINQLFAFLESVARLVSSFASWRIGQPFPESALVLLLGNEFLRAALGNLSRTALWIFSFAQGKSTFDPMVVTLLWSALTWCVSGWAAWGTRRIGEPLIGVLPAAAVFSTILSFTRAEALYLAPVLGGTLLLMAWRSYSGREQHWTQQSTDFAEDLRFDAAMWSLATVVIITGGAMLLSGISPQKSLEFARGLLQPRPPVGEQVGSELGLGSQPGGDTRGNINYPGVLPRQHLLGSGPELSQEIVMLVQVENEPHKGRDCLEPPCSDLNSRYYWRLLTFDLYTGRGWMTSPTRKLQYMRGEKTLDVNPLNSFEYALRVQVLGEPGTQLFSFGEPVWADQDYQVFWRSAPAGEQDLFSVQFRQPLSQGTYQVASIHPVIEELDIRQIPAEYPDWILERYLQLPEGTPSRIFDLAQDLTRDIDSPYEKAGAIERYLRTIPYSLDVPLPPADRDVVDYYLHDIRSGYCDYSATAMVVLARAAGLPARIAIGFASGQYDPQSDLYIVTEANAHSWAEVYFPQIGWIEFEPTAGQSELVRQDMALPPLSKNVVQSGDQPQTPAELLITAGLKILAGTLLLFGSILLIWPAFDSWRLNKMKPGPVLFTLYRRLWKTAARLGLEVEASETPHEFAERLGDKITNRSGPGLRSIFSSASVEIRSITSLYAQSIYSPHSLDENNRRIAVNIWKALRLRLRFAWILKDRIPKGKKWI